MKRKGHILYIELQYTKVSALLNSQKSTKNRYFHKIGLTKINYKLREISFQFHFHFHS